MVASVAAGTVAVGPQAFAAPVITPSGSQPVVTVAEGATFSGDVASFSDANAVADAQTGIGASVDFGDGSGVCPGLVRAANATTLITSCTHGYADEGTYTITVTLAVAVPGGPPVIVTGTNTATVTEADFPVPVGGGLTFVPGSPLTNVPVGGFTEAGNPFQSAGDWTATIDWGDGTTTAGTITGGSGPTGGRFEVAGTHTYTGGTTTWPVTVTVAEDTPGAVPFQVHSTAGLLSPGATQPTVTVPVGATISGAIANFSDANTADTPEDFVATIDWGDGTTSYLLNVGPVLGVSSTGPGAFAVSAPHAYAAPGDMPVTVTLLAVNTGASAVAHNTVTVTMPAPSSGGGGGGGGGAPSPTPPATPPAVEPSSAPLPPCPAGKAGFVCKAYDDLLGRPVDAAGLAFWTAFLNGGGTRGQVVQALVSSGEYRADLVGSMYRAYLHRAADPGGLALGTWLLGVGVRDEAIEAALLGSPEYFATRGGSTNAGFLAALYQDLLHRAPDPSGLASWEAQLTSGTSRAAVAGALLGSPERLAQLVSADYQHYLRRAVDGTGLATWGAALEHGGTDESVIEALVASDEYLALA
jgi:hypothetical protein